MGRREEGEGGRAEGIQLFARRELDPDVLGTAELKELKQLIESLGLEVASLCGDTGGPRYRI